MTAESLQSVEALARSGRFAEALYELNHLRLAGSKCAYLQRALLAELLQRTGDADRASSIAFRIIESPEAPLDVQARCHVILGDHCRDRGQLAEAVHHLHRAITLAQQARKTDARCWAQLVLMLTLAERPYFDASIAILPELRRSVAQLGDPSVTAALHLFVAQIETRRGLLANARHHVRLGRSILDRHHNPWLEGVAAIDLSCLEYLESDFETALKWAERALELAQTAGSASTHRAAWRTSGTFISPAGTLQRLSRPSARRWV